MQTLEKALEIDPEYDDAMAYMNLLIRERADLADTPDEYKKEIEDRRRLGAEGPGDQEDQGRDEESKAAGGITDRIEVSAFSHVNALETG